MKKFINSFKYAFTGVISSFKNERNMKVHVSIMTLVIICGILLKIEVWEWITCLICFGIVISAELFNTAIETIVDMVCPNKDNMAKKAKDISAGAVLMNAIMSLIIGILIFLPKIINLIK